MISSSSMEFDFKTLKRKDLQRLCKKHGLRANSTNSQMADGLASLFKNYEMEKQLKVRLRGSGKSSNKECERVEGKAERILIVLDEEDDEHVPVLGSGAMEYTSMNRRSCGKNEYSEGEKVQPCEENTITFLDEDNLESRSTNSEVPQIPVIELKKTSSNDKPKRKRNSRNSSMKVNDEAAVSLPVEASHNDNLTIDEVLDNTLNRQEIEEYELHTDSSLNTSVSGIGGTKRPQKRTRASLEVEISVMEKDTDELIQPEVDSASLEILKSGNPSNLASSTPRLFLSELQDGQDGGEHTEANEPLSKHRKEESEQEVVDTSGRSSSTSELDRLSKDEETSNQSSAASLSYSQEINDISNERCSIMAGITVMEVVDTSDRRLSSSEFDHVSKDEEASKQSLSISLSYPQDIYDISKRCCSISTDHVRNYVDDCKKCLIAVENHSCAETPVSINGFCLSGEQGCEALESADIVVKEVEVRLGCHNSEGVLEDRDGEKRNESFMEHEYHRDKQDENECQDGYGDKAKGNSSFEKASPILFQEISTVEDDVRDTNSPSSEKFEEMNDNVVGLSLNIEIHDDNNLHYLAGKEFEKVGRDEFQVVQKKEENVKTLSGWFSEALEENYSTELKLTDAPEVTANNLLTREDLGELRMPDDKFQEQAADYEQNLSMSGDKVQEQAIEYGQDLGMSVNKLQEQAADSGLDLDMLGDKFQEQVADFKQGYCEDITKKSENFQKSLDSQHLAPAEINSSQFFETYESTTLPQELSEIKGGGSCGLEGTVQIIPDQLKHDAEIFCGSEEPAQSEGYDKDLEASPTEKIAEIAPFGLSKRVDKLMEKLLCLRKVLRGEITPPVTDSCLPGEEEISCEESHPTNKKQLLPEQKDEVVKTLMLSNSAHEDCEQYSSNSQLNINHVGTQCLQEILDSQADPTLKLDEVRCMESLEANSTDTISLFECNFSCKPIEGQPHQGSDIDVKELLHSPGDDSRKKDFLFSSKHSIDWEGEKNSVAICISKKTKLKHSPAEDNNYFGPQCISDALDGHIPIVQECAHNKPFDILEVESENNSLSRTDTFTSALKASASRNTIDSVEEISHKLIKFRISSIKTPRTKSTGNFKLHSSLGIIRDKENKQNTKMMNFSSSEHKIKSSASAGSIRRPMRSVTNQKLD